MTTILSSCSAHSTGPPLRHCPDASMPPTSTIHTASPRDNLPGPHPHAIAALCLAAAACKPCNLLQHVFFSGAKRCGPMRGQIHAMYSLGPPLLENLLVGRGMTRYTAIWHSPYDNTTRPSAQHSKGHCQEKQQVLVQGTGSPLHLEGLAKRSAEPVDVPRSVHQIAPCMAHAKKHAFCCTGADCPRLQLACSCHPGL